MIKLTQEQDRFIKTFGSLEDEENKKRALYYISRFDYGYCLTDGDEYKSSAFECSEQLKMVEAIINGYEVVELKFKFYNFSDISGNPLYYNGKDKVLTEYEEEALEVEIDSEEYKALEHLGFYKREV